MKTIVTNTDGVIYYDGTALVSTSVGSSTQVLTSNGAGVAPTFQNAAVGTNTFTQVIQQFTSNGTYTPTAGLQYAEIEVWAGGGAGGGAVATGVSTFSIGGGGGAGGYALGVFSAATIGASQAVTIPAAATGVSGNTGNTGGTCSVGALISATGGVGGTASTALTLVAANGGVGGVGSGGSINGYGGQGLPGQQNSNLAISGQGANTNVGEGGCAVVNSTHTAGTAASGYGAGGSGASNANSQTALAGGNGAPGLVLIKEYTLTSSGLSFPVTVPQGGTGNTTQAAYSLVAGGTTTTAHLQAVGPSSSSNSILMGQGSSSLPVFTTSGTPYVTGVSFNSGTNTLSTYGTNTFTPTLNFSGGTTGITYAVQSGVYWKIGQVCFIRAELGVTSKGSSPGFAFVAGLPFASDASNNDLMVWSSGTVTYPTSCTYLIAETVGASSTQCGIYASGSTATITQLSNTNFPVGSFYITINGFYFTSS